MSAILEPPHFKVETSDESGTTTCRVFLQLENADDNQVVAGFLMGQDP
jgi:hypothetical protein